MQNKKVLIAVVALVALLLGGGVFVLGNRGTEEPEQVESLDEEVVEVSPDEIGLKMEATPDNQSVRFMIGKAEGFENLEYELMYEADAETPDAEISRVQRGVSGTDTINGSTYTSEDLYLGSCSRNVCRPDKGINEVNLLLILQKNDGKTYQVEDTLPLE